jgi:hypothetical protein
MPLWQVVGMSTIMLPTAEQKQQVLGEVSQTGEHHPASGSPEEPEPLHDPHARDGRRSETLEEFQARLATIPASVLHDISPELKALTGILPADLDDKNEYAAYYEYMARKHQ